MRAFKEQVSPFSISTNHNPSTNYEAKTKSPPARLGNVDPIRGIAALSVVIFHFSNILSAGAVRTVASLGTLGVPIFFVISGFVISYSLSRDDYAIENYPRFLLKRIVRLHPPYIVTILLIVGLGMFNWYHRFHADQTFQFNWTGAALNLGYLNSAFGYPWLSDVFWALAVELQFYLVIGITFPLLFAENEIVKAMALAALLVPSVSGHALLILPYLPLFVFGILACQWRLRQLHGSLFLAWLGTAAFCLAIAVGWPVVAAGLFSLFPLFFFGVLEPFFHTLRILFLFF